jgi:hypothetical protein
MHEQAAVLRRGAIMSGLDDHRRRKSLAELIDGCTAATGSAPARSSQELQTLVQAAGLAPEDIGADFWRDVRADWLSGDQETSPFRHSGANEEYRFLAAHRGLLAVCLGCGCPAAAHSPFCSSDCARLWTRAKRVYFSQPPLALSPLACDALLALIGGEQPEPAGQRALQIALDGRA